jgi:hypothetical protein
MATTSRHPPQLLVVENCLHKKSNTMMKSYLRFEPKKQFGVIAAPHCNVQYDYTGNLALTGALQSAAGWNLRQAVQVAFEIVYVISAPLSLKS